MSAHPGAWPMKHTCCVWEAQPQALWILEVRNFVLCFNESYYKVALRRRTQLMRSRSASSTMLTVTFCRSECCVPSGLCRCHKMLGSPLDCPPPGPYLPVTWGSHRGPSAFTLRSVSTRQCLPFQCKRCRSILYTQKVVWFIYNRHFCLWLDYLGRRFQRTVW